MFWLLLLISILILILYRKFQEEKKKRKFFESKGISVNAPQFFLVSMYKLITGQMGIVEIVQKLYYEVPGDQKLVGFWDGNRPMLLLKDPDVVKNFTVKHFEHFQDRRDFITDQMDPLFGNSLFVLKEEKWKDMRSTLSPAFTGSKMRLMCDLIVEIGEQMVEHLHKDAKVNGIQTYEMRELFSRVSLDVISSCAFGISVNSLKDKDSAVYKAGKALSDFASIDKMIKFTLHRFFPKLYLASGIKMFPQDESNFFRSLVTKSMKMREQNNIIRPDMIHLLMEAQKGKLKHAKSDHDNAGFATVDESSVGWEDSGRKWSETDIVAQCFLFLLAGFETISSTLSFATYEIAIDPEIQRKIHQEVKGVNNELNGKRINYEKLQKMKYLDMIISETLRKFPPSTAVDRECNKDITLNLYDDVSFDFKKNYALWIPIFAFHRDPKYYPNPEKFDPERFNDENKHLINPSTFIPFGIGPRNCIGSRFALMELKSILYYLILNFNLEPTEKTQIPVKLKKSFGLLQSESGIFLQLRPRN